MKRRNVRPMWAQSRMDGIAMVAVLWIVAALSLIVTSLSSAVRGEVRTATATRQEVMSRGTAEAAINLVLQQMTAQPTGIARMTYVDVNYRGVPMRIQVMPSTGLIDVNNAPEALLRTLYAVGGGADPATATQLARSTVELRSQKDVTGQAIGFEAPEDLMRVPGFPYRLYANISRFITVARQGGDKVDPLSAPDEVLLVLANGNAAVAGRIAAGRDSGQPGVDTTALEAAFIGPSATRRYRLTAEVPLPDGNRYRFSQSVEFQSDATSALPWTILQTAGQMMPASAPRN